MILIHALLRFPAEWLKQGSCRKTQDGSRGELFRHLQNGSGPFCSGPSLWDQLAADPDVVLARRC
jgi:hypothetical protein